MTDRVLSVLNADVDGDRLADLGRRLAERADAAGVLDVAYRMLDSPIGELLVAATDRGLVRVAFHWELGSDDVLQELADRVSPRVLAAPARLDPVARELDGYFAGRRRHFETPLDMRLSRGFRREVLEALRHVDYGRTASYAELAADAGRPRAVRAAATACATNPLPLVIPCHRVIRSDGSLGHYGGGDATKRTLLELEGAL